MSGNTCLNLHHIGYDVLGLMTSLLSVKMASNVWTEEENKYFLHVIKQKNIKTLTANKLKQPIADVILVNPTRQIVA